MGVFTVYKYLLDLNLNIYKYLKIKKDGFQVCTVYSLAELWIQVGMDDFLLPTKLGLSIRILGLEWFMDWDLEFEMTFILESCYT